jgi:hypothetical protein
LSSCATWTTNHFCRWRAPRHKLSLLLRAVSSSAAFLRPARTNTLENDNSSRPTVFSESVCPAVSQITACGTSIFPPARPPHAECIKEETDPFASAERQVSRLISRPVHAHKRRPASFLFASVFHHNILLVLINGKKMPREC